MYLTTYVVKINKEYKTKHKQSCIEVNLVIKSGDSVGAEKLGTKS